MLVDDISDISQTVILHFHHHMILCNNASPKETARCEALSLLTYMKLTVNS